jgi:hypothetical protein
MQMDDMSASTSDASPTFGFITVASVNDDGLVGGFLVLNTTARPLEFHCTAPVKPNRAQEVLYGPTLRPYLHGEQIATTLLNRAKRKPLFAFTDDPHVLAARTQSGVPIVLVMPAPGVSGTEPAWQPATGDGHAVADRGVKFFSFGNQRMAVSPGHPRDEQLLRDHWERDLSGMDLCEPFGRIHEAIQEAQTTR